MPHPVTQQVTTLRIFCMVTLDRGFLRRCRDASDKDSEAPQLLEATLLSMQALQEAYGTSSAEFRAAWQALRSFIASIPDTVASAYGDRVAQQISLLGRVASPGKDGLYGLLQWRDHHRRRHLLSQDTVGMCPDTSLVVRLCVCVVAALAPHAL